MRARSLDDHLKWQYSVTGSYPSDTLKNPNDVDKWQSVRLYLPVRRVSVVKRVWAVLVWSGVVKLHFESCSKREIGLTMNVQYNCIVLNI